MGEAYRVADSNGRAVYAADFYSDVDMLELIVEYINNTAHGYTKKVS